MSPRWGCTVALRPEVPRSRSVLATAVATGVFLATAAFVVYLNSNWERLTTPLQDDVAAIPDLQAAELRAEQAAAGSRSLLILILDSDGRLGAVALAAGAEGATPTLALIPTTLFDLLPGYGDFALSEATLFEGPELARLAVANELGVRIDRVAQVPAGTIASLGGSLEVELSEVVIDAGEDASFAIAEPGTSGYEMALVERLLTTQFDSSAVGWLERQAAVWRALLPWLAADPARSSMLLGAGPGAEMLAGVAAGGATVSLVPVEPVAVAGASDGFQVVQADLATFVAERLGHLALAAEAKRPRVEVLNGNGELLATRSVVEALVGAGFHVVKTDNADNFDFAETIVIAQGRDNRSPAEDAAGTLGVKSVQLEVVAPSGVVDVSIIVGQDIATLRS